MVDAHALTVDTRIEILSLCQKLAIDDTSITEASVKVHKAPREVLADVPSLLSSFARNQLWQGISSAFSDAITCAGCQALRMLRCGQKAHIGISSSVAVDLISTSVYPQAKGDD